MLVGNARQSKDLPNLCLEFHLLVCIKNWQRNWMRTVVVPLHDLFYKHEKHNQWKNRVMEVKSNVIWPSIDTILKKKPTDQMTWNTRLYWKAWSIVTFTAGFSKMPSMIRQGSRIFMKLSGAGLVFPTQSAAQYINSIRGYFIRKCCSFYINIYPWQDPMQLYTKLKANRMHLCYSILLSECTRNLTTL